MPSGFYRNFDALAGLGYDGSAHHQFGFPMSGSVDAAGAAIAGGIDWIHGLLSATENSSKLYAWATDPAGSNAFAYRSLDAGATWSQRGQFPGRNGQIADANGTTAQPTDQVWVSVHTDNSFTARRDGVWRSTDDGSTWSRILNCEGVRTVNFMSGSTPTSTTGPRGCFSVAFGSSKLWFCWEVSALMSNSPYPSPPQGTALYRIEQANADGSARTTIGEITLYANSAYNQAHDNVELPLRPWGDSFALVPSSQAQPFIPPTPGTSMLWKVDAAGGAVQVPLPGGLVLDAVPLGPSTYLLLTWESSAQTVTIYRTTNAGTSWSIQRVLSGHEWAGWGGTSPIAADTFGCWQIAAIPGTNDVFVNGGQGTVGPAGSGANQTASLTTWYSSDLGVSWSAIVDTTAPADTAGHWMLGRQLGICPGTAAVVPAVAIPSRLATIVG